MKTSDTTKIISDALAKTQGQVPNIPKRGKGNYGNYATLDDGLDVCRKLCSANDISITQSTRMSGDIMVLDTRLSCGNEWIEAEYPVIRFPANQQAIGSALTYSRRYSLFALIGIAGDDDDGTAANDQPVTAPGKITEVQFAELQKLIGETDTDPLKFEEYLKIKGLKNLPASRFDEAKAALNRKIKVAA